MQNRGDGRKEKQKLMEGLWKYLKLIAVQTPPIFLGKQREKKRKTIIKARNGIYFNCSGIRVEAPVALLEEWGHQNPKLNLMSNQQRGGIVVSQQMWILKPILQFKNMYVF